MKQISIISCAGMLAACSPVVKPVPSDWPKGEPERAQDAIRDNTHIVFPPMIRDHDIYSEMLMQFYKALEHCGIAKEDAQAFMSAHPDIGDEMTWVPVNNFDRYPNETFSFRCPDTERVIQ